MAIFSDRGSTPLISTKNCVRPWRLLCMRSVYIMWWRNIRHVACYYALAVLFVLYLGWQFGGFLPGCQFLLYLGIYKK